MVPDAFTGTREKQSDDLIRDVVHIHDDGPRIGWKLTVVEDVVSGNDGLVRPAKFRTLTGVTYRPIVRLPLEV